MPKLTWTLTQWGETYTADLGHGLKLSVSRELVRLPDGEPTFNVSVFGRRLKTRTATVAEAQERAERVALAWLAEMTAKLSGEETPPPSA